MKTILKSATVGEEFACSLVENETATETKYSVLCCYAAINKHLLESNDCSSAESYMDGLVDGTALATGQDAVWQNNPTPISSKILLDNGK
jgi:hypothetical protein